VAAHFINSYFWERDAVLVDTPITVEQARALADWLRPAGRIDRRSTPPMAMVIISLVPVQFWSGFQVLVSSRGRSD